MENTVNVRIPAALWADIRDMAVNERRSATSQLAVVIERGIAASGRGELPHAGANRDLKMEPSIKTTRKKDVEKSQSPQLQTYLARQKFVEEHGRYPDEGETP